MSFLDKTGLARLWENIVALVSTKVDATALNNYYTKTETDSMLNGSGSSDHTHTVSDISDLTVTATELNYMDGATSNVQTQLNNLSTLVGDTPVSSQINTAIGSAIGGSY